MVELRIIQEAIPYEDFDRIEEIILKQDNIKLQGKRYLERAIQDPKGRELNIEVMTDIHNHPTIRIEVCPEDVDNNTQYDYWEFTTKKEFINWFENNNMNIIE